MLDGPSATIPDALDAIERETESHDFDMPSDRRTGSLLRTLAASKPDGRLLELGTGTGLSTAWLLSGMDRSARLDSIDDDPDVLRIARRHLGNDERVRFRCEDGHTFIGEAGVATYDLIFADTWPGKYEGLDQTLDLLKPGGLYVIDDMDPQPNWPAGHEDEVDRLLGELARDPRLELCRMDWSTGLIVGTRRTKA